MAASGSAGHERVRQHLRAACLAGDQAKVAALLRLDSGPWFWPGCFGPPGRGAVQSDQQAVLRVLTTPFREDGGNTLLHYLCCGRQLGGLGRLLWASSGGAAEVLPGRHDSQRAQLLAWLLARYPALLALADARNGEGWTALQGCLRSNSMDTLQVLLAALRVLSPSAQRVVLGMPGPGGVSAFELALQQQQWEAVQLLAHAGAHLLTHDFLAALEQVALRVNPGLLASRGLFSGKVFEGAISSSSGSGATAGGTLVQGLLQGVGRLLDWASGQAHERDAVLRHQAQQATSRMGGTDRGGEGVEVLQGTSEVQRLRRQQIETTAYVLGLSAPEAAALLAEHGWNELAVMRSRLGGSEAITMTAPLANGDVAAVAVGYDPGSHPCQRSTATRPSCAPLPDPAGGAAAQQDPQHGGLATREQRLTSVERYHQPMGPSKPHPAHRNSGGGGSSGDGSGGCGTLQCIVCYEDCGGSGGAWRALPCGHPTCDACWKGILLAQLDTGEVHRVVCPQPGCGMPLHVEAAEGLLSRQQYRRYQELLTQSYVDTNPSLRWCPRPGCGNVVRLVGSATAPGALASGSLAGPGEAAAAAAAGEAAAVPPAVTVQCACGHSFCWACSGDAHEPATCDQMRQWGEQLSALRRDASDQDEGWLARNTKRCPQCTAPIQKHGGCNHMTCRSCRHQWCWECGQAWAQHSAETGGYYHCLLERRVDLQDFQQATPRPLTWLRDVWGAIQGAASQHVLDQQLRQFLRHDFNPAQLSTLAAHAHRLLAALGFCSCEALHGAAGLRAGSRPAPAGDPHRQAGKHVAATETLTVEGRDGTVVTVADPLFQLGPEVLPGVTLREACAMGRRQWAHLVAATAESLADSGQLQATSSNSSSTSNGGTPGRGSLGGCQPGPLTCGTASMPRHSIDSRDTGVCRDLARLVQQVGVAHRALQHAAVAGWALGGFGPRRRFLGRLCEEVEGRVGRLEGLLLAMPDREAALQCQQLCKALNVWAAGSHGIARLVGRLLGTLYGVRPPGSQGSHEDKCSQEEPQEQKPAGAEAGGGPPGQRSSDAQHLDRADALQQARSQQQQRVPNHHHRQQQQQRQRARLRDGLARGLSVEQLRRQALFALALHQQASALRAELEALKAAVGELQQAGRAGLFATR
ncbi:hypothetical protein N2152v2_001333 [Parachlorella kessleri]